MDDIHASFDYGYDPDTVEACPIVIPAPPSSFAWAAIYGLATHKAARAAGRPPLEPALQASPHYPYIKILERHGGRPGAGGSGLISS